MRTTLPLTSIAAVTLLAACSGPGSADANANAPAVTTAAQAIIADALLGHIKDLSADSMEGRAPGTPGEDKAVAYMQRSSRRSGSSPATRTAPTSRTFR